MGEIDIIERMKQVETKIGITKDGMNSGNGIISEISLIKEDIENMYTKIDELILLTREVSVKIDSIDQDVRKIKIEMKDKINFGTIGTVKNVIIGISSLLTAFGVIGYTVYLIYTKLIK